MGSIPTGVRDFSLSPCGPISFLAYVLGYYLGYLYSTSTYNILTTIYLIVDLYFAPTVFPCLAVDHKPVVSVADLSGAYTEKDTSS